MPDNKEMIVQTDLAIIGELRQVLKRLHYPLEVMLVCARWYAAYPLSLRHIQAMIAKSAPSTCTVCPSAQPMSAAGQFYSLAF